MAHVQVTFSMEITDADDGTGLSAEDFDNLLREVASIGGYDVDSEIVED